MFLSHEEAVPVALVMAHIQSLLCHMAAPVLCERLCVDVYGFECLCVCGGNAK